MLASLASRADERALIVRPLEDLVPRGATYTLEIIQLAILFVLRACLQSAKLRGLH